MFIFHGREGTPVSYRKVVIKRSLIEISTLSVEAQAFLNSAGLIVCRSYQINLSFHKVLTHIT